MQQDINIRIATLYDLQQISEVFEASIRELCKNDYDHETIDPWATSAPAVSRLEDLVSNSLWVAEVNGVIAGYVVSEAGELMELFVSPTYAGLGIGRVLGELGIKLARKNHSGAVLLESTLNAAPFYEKLGFKAVGHSFFSHGESAIKIPIIKMTLPN